MVAATKRNRQQRSQGEEPKENEMCLGPRQTFMVALHNYPLNSFEHLSIVILLKHLIFSDVKIPSDYVCLYIYSTYCFWKGFTPGGASGKEPACQNRTLKETWVPSLGGKDPLEKGLATHFSIISWRIPLTEEPGGLQFMASQRVVHD